MRLRSKAWVILAGGLLMALASCSHREAAKPQAKNEYVDTAICADCHTEIARTYAGSGMARSFSAPTAASFPNPKPYFHSASATWYENVAKDGGWVQRWWQKGIGGKEESAGESKIDFVMGSGNHVRTYLHRTARGTLIELPLAWYAEKGGSWALNPGLDESNPATGRKIGYDCMFCHNSYPSIPAGHDEAGAEPVYAEPMPQGIDCQRCHGPGGNHLQAVNRPGAKVEEIRAAIVNPSRLEKDRAMEVCLQCHLETTSAFLPNVIRRYDRGPFSYRPGEALSAFQLAFDHAPGSGREGKFEIVSSVYRLRQSKCFLESKGELGCTTCHNPHDIRHGEQAIDLYNKVCARCHAPAETAAPGHPAGANCVGCHMPKRRAEDVVHVVMTDHLIQRRPPANPLAEFPERHDPGLEYKGEVVPYGDKDDLYTAVAQVTHKSNLEAGIPRLQAEIAKAKPERPEFSMELGDALQRVGRSEESAAAYRAALEKRPGSALLWARLAQPLRALGKSQEPLEAMQKSVQADPNDAENWYNLALLQSNLGDKTSAVQSFRKSLELDPESADTRKDLGSVLAETGQVQEAEVQLRGALSLRPALPEAHAYLAFLLANRGEMAEAVSHFERGGDGASNQFNYGITLARMNRRADARTHLEKSLKADANQPFAHEVLGGLLEADGKVPEAVSHYREALRLRPDFGKAHLDLGAVLARQGDRTRAAAEFRAAQADPDPQIRQMAGAGLAAVGAK
ncbi:MAG TPA: tetratricopeptide repeat protein [Bryobacteraceae bacterium]|jgi:Flp pilus assembly protein TadD